MQHHWSVHRVLSLAVALCLALLLVPAPAAAQDEEEEFTSDFFIEECSFSDRGRNNRFWSLEPGDSSTLVGLEDLTVIELFITVLDETELIELTAPSGDRMRVRARVIEERELEDGELIEISRNFFARCRETNDIFYFGEEVDIYEDGELVSHEGAWRAGEEGAQPGIIMPGTFLLGARYFQEIAPGVALDRAENVEMDLDVELPIPDGSFERCVEVVETTPLDPDADSVKQYCPGIGLVDDDGLRLTAHEVAPDPEPPSDDWLTAPQLHDFEVQVRITSGDDVQPIRQEVVSCDAETVCVSGGVPGRVEVLVRVPGPRPNGCFWPTITKLTSSQVEVWVRQISTGEIRYYRVDGSSPGSSDLPGFFDREGFCL